jgi:hypothetical protein
MLRIIGALVVVGRIFLWTGSDIALAQSSDWSAVQALTSGQQVLVHTKVEPMTADFQSATATTLVVTRRGNIVYIDRSDVRQVAYIVKRRSAKWTVIGLAFGAAVGTLAAQGAGFVTIPIDMALFGGLGAWADHKNATTRVVVVYQATP